MTDVQQIDTSAVDAQSNGGARPNGKVANAPVSPAPVEVSRPPAPPRVDKRDPRYLALRNFAISMSVFNILGYAVLGFEQPWTWPLFAVAVGYAVELTAETLAAWAGKRAPGYSGHGMWGLYTFLLPTHITALAVNMLLYANDRFLPIAFGTVVGVGGKYVLRAPINGRMRHFMNPSNLVITATLVAFPFVNMVPPYHFTENVSDVFRIMIPMIIITAGTVLNTQLTKKTPLIVGWVGSFVIQALLRHYIWGVALWGALLPMTGVAFVLFTNYMITDPGTTPSKGRYQFMFGSAVGFVYGILMIFNIVYTLFFAVCIVCLARGGYWWARWLLERRRERAVATEPKAAPTLQPAAAT